LGDRRQVDWIPGIEVMVTGNIGVHVVLFAAQEDAHASADTGFHPGGIVERGALPAVFGGRLPP